MPGKLATTTVSRSEPATLSRQQVIAYRWRAHQLDREPASARAGSEVDLLEFGVQDTGIDGARWALALRGLEVTPEEFTAAADENEFVMLWTIRMAPHLYRRADLAEVTTATAPLTERDAAKRVFDAAPAMRSAGMSVLDGLRLVAELERDVTIEPTVKGQVSSALTPRLPEPFVRDCRPCKARHCWEGPFRLAAAHGGLELVPATSPPVLRRSPQIDPPEYRRLGEAAQPAFHVVRNYLRFYGPSTPKAAAAFLDAALADVREHWPSDVLQVSIAGTRPSNPRDAMPCLLAGDLAAARQGPARSDAVRLLGSHDGYLQLRDRDLLVPDPQRRKELWRTLGRPGAVALDGEIVGAWRAATAAKGSTLTWTPWQELPAKVHKAVAAQAERLAIHRHRPLFAVQTS